MKKVATAAAGMMLLVQRTAIRIMSIEKWRTAASKQPTTLMNSASLWLGIGLSSGTASMSSPGGRLDSMSSGTLLHDPDDEDALERGRQCKRQGPGRQGFEFCTVRPPFPSDFGPSVLSPSSPSFRDGSCSVS